MGCRQKGLKGKQFQIIRNIEDTTSTGDPMQTAKKPAPSPAIK